MTAPIAATATTHGLAKILGACVLAAGLTVGGTAAVTGNLPDGAQRAVADAGAAVGLDLPRPGVPAAADGGATAPVFDVVSIDGVCAIQARLDDESRIVLGGITTEAGFSAEVAVHTADLVVVDLSSAAQDLSVALTARAGTIHAEIIARAGAGGTGGVDVPTGPDDGAVIDTGLSAAVGAGIEIEASLDDGNDASGDAPQPSPSPCGVCDDGDGGLGLDASLDLGTTLDATPIPALGAACGCDSSPDGGLATTVEAETGVEIGIGLGG